MNKPKILLTNDDGISSPGILAAAEALMPLGKVIVAAPLTQQTSMGRSYCGNREARLEPYEFTVNGTKLEAYSMEASPAAIVRHVFLALPGLAPDIVVSGINYGENIGWNVTGSGTVGAALEGAAWKVPSLAMSLETDIASQYLFTKQDWTASGHFTRFFAECMLRKAMPEGVDVLKVEVPANATRETPWRMTRLSPFTYYAACIENPSVSSRRGDTVFTKRSGADEPPDTDAYAIRTAKVVSVTPLSLDMTAATPLNTVFAWIDDNI